MDTDALGTWTSWGERRPAPRVLHLDSAAAGRPSVATLEIVAAHARLEAEVGAYVAQDQAAAVLSRLRADIGGLLGLPADGVAFVESASAARAALLDAWPLPPGARVGVLPVEWGPNLEVFAARGLTLVDLPADRAGALDLEAFAGLLATDPPDVVHLTHVTSHRGLVQPVAPALELTRAAGVPLWVDAAQALGHVDVAYGADAVYGTSRKWLTGPRGVGILAVAEPWWERLRVVPRAMDPGLPPTAYLESHEAHIAGRLGLANAVGEYLELGPSVVAARLDEIGRLTRAALADVPGWAVVDGGPAAGAITAIRPTAGQDVIATRARLLADHAILTTAGAIARAPRELREPLLRISPHVDGTPADLARLASALPAS